MTWLGRGRWWLRTSRRASVWSSPSTSRSSSRRGKRTSRRGDVPSSSWRTPSSSWIIARGSLSVTAGRQRRHCLRLSVWTRTSMPPRPMWRRPSSKLMCGATWQRRARMSTLPACSTSTRTRAASTSWRCPRSSIGAFGVPPAPQKLQEMDERRTARLREGYGLFSETERQVMPIVGKCLEGMKVAAEAVDEKSDSQLLIELHKSGFERPGDVEFEDFSQPMNRASSDSSLGTPRGPSDVRVDPRLLGKNKAKRWPFSKKNKPPPHSPASSPLPPLAPLAPNGSRSPKFARDPLSYCLNEINKTVKPCVASLRSLRWAPVITEDFSHLPPEQRRKKLQQKIEDRNRELQKEIDQRDALNKMKDVYQKTPQMGDPASLEPKIAETLSTIEKLRLEIQKYESWLADAEGRALSNRPDNAPRGGHQLDPASAINNNVSSHDKDSPDAPHSEDGTDTLNQPIYTEFDDDFEEELVSPIGSCVAMYRFEGSSEGTISMAEGEELSLVEEDKGDGWTRVRRGPGDEGYVPTSYLRLSLH
ncbi:cdc42-interacting protein 4 isoform X4 [Alligator mississippiensis]|uniref:cdc42-interacting protein 4 isoform X4 n=1 Tax=Alligator mississippiensis TaxID=8496 RepID=UPI0007113B7D|nr:cdc42-interacting protein 4 isoform X4 [Alligator mississippiensis]